MCHRGVFADLRQSSGQRGKDQGMGYEKLGSARILAPQEHDDEQMETLNLIKIMLGMVFPRKEWGHFLLAETYW